MPPSTHPAVRTALVVGGGVAGPVTAAALTKSGIEATVVEAYPEPSEGIGGSLALAPNGLAALAVIGADDAVRSHALPITRSTMSVNGRVLGETPTLDGAEPLQLIDRGPLHDVLREAARSAGVTTLYDRRLVGVEEHDDRIVARFADGSTAAADILVGADGVRSTVRRLIDPDAPAAGYTGMLGFEGYAPHVDLASPPGEMVFAFGRRAYYLYWSLPGGGVGWGANLPSTTYQTLAESRQTPAEQWLAVLAETYAGDDPGAQLVADTAPEHLQVTGALHIMPPVPHWARGRMVLVGDAVHAPSNSTGQGASLAMESGIELARCLRDLPDHGSSFAAYERLRRTRVEAVARRGAKINSVKAPGPVARALMTAIMPMMLKRMARDSSLAKEQGFLIDWDARVA